MFQKSWARVALIVLAVFLSGVFLYRNYMRKDQQGKPLKDIVTLGLDLKGGIHLKLEIDDSRMAMTPEQRADAVDRALTVVRMRIDEMGVAEPVVQKSGTDRIIVELPGLAQENRAKEILQQTAALRFQIVRPFAELQPVLPRIERAIVAALPAEARANQQAQSGVDDLFKTKDDQKAAGDSAVLARPFQSKIASAVGEGQVLVAKDDVAAVERYLALPEVQRLLPRGTALQWGVVEAEEQEGFRSLYFLEREAIMTGEYLENAIAQTDQFNRPIVAFELNRQGGRIFGRETAEHLNDQMAIVLDDRVYTAPVIQGQIRTNGQIELGTGATMEEASDLALVLRAGALPAPLKIVEERTIGPSLGQDSVDNGKLAGMIGIAAVVLMILAYYRLAGVFAVIALGLYVLFILGSLAGMGAALSFPGIAGLVLSIGMAVDANVLIFERIREELAAGRAVRPAVQEGFKNAMSAIVDSNITTLITAAILYYIGGAGPIRGFAVTLAVGIIASMFTAIFVVRTLFLVYLERRSPAAQGLSI